MKIILLILIFLATNYCFEFNNDNKPIPVVLWHGMGDSCCNPLSMGRVKKLIINLIPEIYIHSIMVGDNIIEDIESGFFSNMNDVIENTCKLIKSDNQLNMGFHAIGFSQGGLFLRALVQRCKGIKVLNLISIGGPQQGIYGLPHCTSQKGLCDTMRKILQYGAYSPLVQKFSVQAQYWHDPFVSEEYASKNIFLADLNCANESVCNSSYKTNLITIKNFVLVKFLQDEMVIPKESEWFGYYVNDNATITQSLKETELYKKDLIGLKLLDKDGKLHLLSINGRHLQMSTDELEFIINKFVK